MTKIGIPKEIHPGEKRVAATPQTILQLKKLGFDVAVEAGAGHGINCLERANIAKQVRPSSTTHGAVGDIRPCDEGAPAGAE